MKNRIPTIDQFISESFFSNLNVGEEAKTRTWLDEMGIKNYTINKDGTVDVKGDVILYNQSLTEIPIKFNKVAGWVDYRRNKLTSLKSAPKEVGGSFYCSYNNLSSLKGAPKEIRWDFDCSYNNITSLKGAPKEVGGDFYCNNNKVKFIKEDVSKVSNVKGEIITKL